jgi:sugar lactone lactonase YvrE
MKRRIYLVLAILLAIVAVLAQFFPFDRSAPEVAIQPEPGRYSEAIEVSMSSEKGAKIFFAMGESDPMPYQGPLPLTRDTMVTYFARDWWGNESEPMVADYKVRLDSTPPVTTASPRGGKFFKPISVTLRSEPGAVIRYTVDGSAPGRSSAVYEKTIRLRKETSLKFFATDEAGNEEKVQTVKYRINIDNTRPVTLADPSGGIFSQPVTVTLEPEAGATIYYTQGSERPTTKSPRYTQPIKFSRSGILRFFSVDEAGNKEEVREEQYVIDMEAPAVKASPSPGTFARAVKVTLSSSERGEVRYELDGQEAGVDSPIYKAPLGINKDTVLSVVAVDLAGNMSRPARLKYVIDTQPPTVQPRPPGGAYSGRIRVKLEASEPADIFYTTDGSRAGPGSTPYRGPINISSNMTLSFMAVDKVGNRSKSGSQKYILDQTPPKTAAEPVGGEYSGPVKVSLATEKGATIRYTLDNTSPSAASKIYSVPLTITRDTVLKFYATDTSGNKEEIRIEKYSFDTTPPATVIDPAPGIYSKPVSVSLRSEKGGQVFFRLNPKKDFVVYKSPFVLDRSGKVYFYSVDQTGNKESVQVAEYTIDRKPPVTIPYPAPGEYNPPITLQLKTEDSAKVHYTLDGNPPSTSSPVYTSPLALNDAVTVKFFAIDSAGNREKVRSADYSVASGLWRDNSNGVFIHPSVIDDDLLWVGGEEGLFRVNIDNKRRKNFTTRAGLISNSVRALAVDRLGFKWLGTDKGVSQFDGKSTWVTYDYSDGLASNRINCVVVDPLDNIWFGTDRGLSMFDRKTFRNLTTADGLPSNNVTAMAVDANGIFWIGTDQGLVMKDGKKTTVFTTSDGLPDDHVLTVINDGGWNIWVGTRSGGVARYDGSRWIRYTTAQGLPGSTVNVITVDLADNKWVGTDAGVYKFDGGKFIHVPAPVYR